MREAFVIYNLTNLPLNLNIRQNVRPIAPGQSITIDHIGYVAEIAISPHIKALLSDDSIRIVRMLDDIEVVTYTSANAGDIAPARLSDVGGGGGGGGSYLPLSGGSLTGNLSLNGHQLRLDSAATISSDGSGYTTFNGSYLLIEGSGDVYFNMPAFMNGVGIQFRDTENHTSQRISGGNDDSGINPYIAFNGNQILLNNGSGSGGSLINLDGGTLQVGNGSYLGTGTFDAGGAHGISLFCTVGYELNWQAGYLSLGGSQSNWFASVSGLLSMKTLTTNSTLNLGDATDDGTWASHIRFLRSGDANIDIRVAAADDGLILRNFNSNGTTMFSFRDYNDTHIWDLQAGGRSLFNGATDDMGYSVQIGGSASLRTVGSAIFGGAVSFADATVQINSLNQNLFGTSGNVFYLFSGSGGLRINKQDNSDWIVTVSNTGDTVIKGVLQVGNPGADRDISFGGTNASLIWGTDPVANNSINYSNGQLIVTGSAGFKVNYDLVMNGRIKGYTGTKYADNAAAIAGGLAVGDIYATSTGEVRVVV